MNTKDNPKTKLSTTLGRLEEEVKGVRTRSQSKETSAQVDITDKQDDRPSAPPLPFTYETDEETDNEDNTNVSNPTSNALGTPPNTPDPDPPITTMAADIPITSKFVGRIADRTDPDRHRLEAYDVSQFLGDVEARITSKKITDEQCKIKEARLLVSSTKGDAIELFTSQVFQDIQTFAALKAKCLAIWKPLEERDKFNNLMSIRERKPSKVGYTYMAGLDVAVRRVISDIKLNNNFSRGQVNNEDYFKLDEVVRYITYGTIYSHLTDEYRSAFKKVELDPKDDFLDLYTKIDEKVVLNSVRNPDDVTLLTKSTRNAERRNPKVKGQPHQGQPSQVQNAQGQSSKKGSIKQKGNKGNQQKQHEGQGQSQQGKPYQGQPRQGQPRSNQGYGSYQGRWGQSSYKPELPSCDNCGRRGHTIEECRACGFCNALGHNANDCIHKKRHFENLQASGQQQNNPPSESTGQSKNDNNN